MRAARGNARALRAAISNEMWETLNTFFHWLSERSLLHEASQANVHALYDGVKERCHLFQGVAQGTMVHDEGWEFFVEKETFDDEPYSGHLVERMLEPLAQP